MQERFLIGLGGVALAGTMAWSAFAAVPPPPVNQYLGIPDGVFNDLVEDDCRACHEDPTIVDDANIPDRHHNRVGTTIPDGTDAPFEPNTPGDTYECFSCHNLVYNSGTGAYEFETFRDCLFCHDQDAGEASVHHLTNYAQDGDCQHCHGSLVSNMFDGHDIPTYDPSLITPWPSGKAEAGPNGEGSCDFCHSIPDTTQQFYTDPGSGVDVYQNFDTHHGTGFGSDGTKCEWCHDTSAAEDEKIRQCEVCHGIDTLHNIEYDNVGDGVTPGEEAAYYGHIGAQDDCWGCHGFTSSSSSTSVSTSLVPGLTSLSARSWNAGQEVELTLRGTNFENTIVIDEEGTTETFYSNVRLTDAAGNEFEFTPTSSNVNELTARITADLPAGNYQVVAVKSGKISPPMVVSVLPEVRIDGVSCSQGLATINGAGFSTYVNSPDVPMNVERTVTLGRLGITHTEELNVVDWTDERITVDAGVCCGSFAVNSIFGTATFDARCRP